MQANYKGWIKSTLIGFFLSLSTLSVTHANAGKTYQFFLETGTLTYLGQKLPLMQQEIQMNSGEMGQMAIQVMGEAEARDVIHVYVDAMTSAFYFAERATMPSDVMREARRYGGILRASSDRFEQESGYTVHINTRNTRLVINARQINLNR